ncbi:MAG: nucleoside kinase [Muribaculaceae bacterium]|nr:nucleoside kinase [Muribaculaceae bacterium]
MKKYDELKVFCKNTKEYISIDGGEVLIDLYDTIKGRLSLKGDAVCVMVNNKVEDLHYPVFSPKHVEFIDITSNTGYRVMTRSLCMVLYKALNDLYPGKRLCIQHSISNGHYCQIKHEEEFLTPEVIEKLKQRMTEIIDEDIPFQRRERLTTDVIEMFRKQGLKDKVRLLEGINQLYTVYYKLDDIIDSFFGPLVPSTGMLKVFDLIPYEEGMLLLGPDRNQLDQVVKWEPQPKLFKAFTDHINFNKIIRLGDVGELNRAIKDGYAPLLINVVEALHNKHFIQIADEITRRYHEGGARVVLIAGPSSSGKTTSSKRLAIQLMTNYIVPKVIELDNYFVNRDRTPRDETGDYDYESLYSLDLEQFNKDVTDLLAGKEVAMPTYNFKKGEREYLGNTLKLSDGDILLMEGIHGLNPELTRLIPDNQKFRLFVSALTTLSIDDHNWIGTYDNRLLRRIIRDHMYRGSNALQTIQRWPSVRRGEDKWIMPFHENADAMFNSSLLFELSVMKNYALPILQQVPSNTPEYAEASRLMKFLSYFEPLDEKDIPSTSLLREFLGGSSFHY